MTGKAPLNRRALRSGILVNLPFMGLTVYGIIDLWSYGWSAVLASITFMVLVMVMLFRRAVAASGGLRPSARHNWDFDKMQPKRGSFGLPVPRVDWSAHEGEAAFVHAPDWEREDLRFAGVAYCLNLPESISTLDSLRDRADVFERTESTLFAQFVGRPSDGQGSGARVWASERDSRLRVVVAYSAASTTTSAMDAALGGDSASASMAVSATEWYKEIAKLCIHDASTYTLALRLADPSELYLYSEGLTDTPKRFLLKIAAILIGGFATAAILVVVLDRLWGV